GAAGDPAASHGLRVLGTIVKPITADQVRDLLSRSTGSAVSQPARAPLQLAADDLARGLVAGEIVALYQPKVSLESRAFVGVEALARWRHPTLGMVPPDAFVPLAEANGLMSALTDQVLCQAIDQCAAWRADGLRLDVSVNFSGEDFVRLDLPEATLARVRAAGMEPMQL